MIETEDFVWFLDEALDGMVAIVEQLGDRLANQRPDLPGANSPYAILTHCLGVMEFWAGHVVAGRVVERDRAGEFVATGAVADLVSRVSEARRRLERDLAEVEPLAGPRCPLEAGSEDAGLPIARTQGGALVHVYEELAQHRGQMELTRDLLLASG